MMNILLAWETKIVLETALTDTHAMGTTHQIVNGQLFATVKVRAAAPPADASVIAVKETRSFILSRVSKTLSKGQRVSSGWVT